MHLRILRKKKNKARFGGLTTLSGAHEILLVCATRLQEPEPLVREGRTRVSPYRAGNTPWLVVLISSTGSMENLGQTKVCVCVRVSPLTPKSLQVIINLGGRTEGRKEGRRTQYVSDPELISTSEEVDRPTVPPSLTATPSPLLYSLT